MTIYCATRRILHFAQRNYPTNVPMQSNKRRLPNLLHDIIHLMNLQFATIDWHLNRLASDKDFAFELTSLKMTRCVWMECKQWLFFLPYNSSTSWFSGNSLGISKYEFFFLNLIRPRSIVMHTEQTNDERANISCGNESISCMRKWIYKLFSCVGKLSHTGKGIPKWWKAKQQITADDVNCGYGDEKKTKWAK